MNPELFPDDMFLELVNNLSISDMQILCSSSKKLQTKCNKLIEKPQMKKYFLFTLLNVRKYFTMILGGNKTLYKQPDKITYVFPFNKEEIDSYIQKYKLDELWGSIHKVKYTNDNKNLDHATVILTVEYEHKECQLIIRNKNEQMKFISKFIDDGAKLTHYI